MLKLSVDPTFRAKVGIPRAGQSVVTIGCTFKYKSREELIAWQEEVASMQIHDAVKTVLVDWSDVELPFSDDAFAMLVDAYPGAALAMYRKYLDEVTGAKAGN